MDPTVLSLLLGAEEEKAVRIVIPSAEKSVRLKPPHKSTSSAGRPEEKFSSYCNVCVAGVVGVALWAISFPCPFPGMGSCAISAKVAVRSEVETEAGELRDSIAIGPRLVGEENPPRVEIEEDADCGAKGGNKEPLRASRPIGVDVDDVEVNVEAVASKLPRGKGCAPFAGVESIPEVELKVEVEVDEKIEIDAVRESAVL